MRRAPDIVDLGSQWHHMHRKTIASERSLGRQHTRIDGPSHAGQQSSRNAFPEAFDYIALSHAFSCNDVALRSGLLAGDERQVCASIRVVLYPINFVRSRLSAIEVDCAYPSPMTASSMSHSDASTVVASTFPMSNLCKCELQHRPTLPKMVIDGTAKMS